MDLENPQGDGGWEQHGQAAPDPRGDVPWRDCCCFMTTALLVDVAGSVCLFLNTNVADKNSPKALFLLSGAVELLAGAGCMFLAGVWCIVKSRRSWLIYGRD